MTEAPTEILTERLQLACWQESDATELREVLDRNDAHLRPWIPFMQAEPRSLADTVKGLLDCRAVFDRGEHYRYALRERESKTLVGEAMLIGRGGPNTLEAGYWLDQQHCGKGYATEATRALLPVAFHTLGIGRVLLRCDQRNVKSAQVAERLGGRRIDIETVVENDRAMTLIIFACYPTPSPTAND